MPSSTSSSDPRLKPPAGPWLPTWLLAGALALSVLGGLELFWRGRGHEPSVVDDLKLWAAERGRVYENNPDTIVLLGTSRMLTDVLPDALRREAPGYPVVQLAVDGKSPAAALVDLAEDGKFRGVVVAEFPDYGLLRSQRNDQADHVENFHDRGTLDNLLNRRIASFFQSHLVVLNPQTGLRKVIESLLKGGRLPKPAFVVTRPDRSQLTYYSRTDVAENRAFRLARVRRGYEMNPPPPPDEWLAQARELEPSIRKIQDRGGRVVIVRFPTTGESWEMDEAHYPKASYWDRFADGSSATVLHFKDLPPLDAFDCPDTSHLDEKDAPAFTKALAEELEKRGVLRKG